MDVLAPDLVDFASGPLSFEEWLEKVDEEVIRISGFGRDAFRDWEYADAFEARVEPQTAAIAALSEDHVGREFLMAAGIDPEVL